MEMLNSSPISTEPAADCARLLLRPLCQMFQTSLRGKGTFSLRKRGHRRLPEPKDSSPLD